MHTIYLFSIYLCFVRVHAVSIGLTVECLTEKIDDLLQQAGLGTVSTGDILDIIPGYIGDGYGTVSEQVLGKHMRIQHDQ